MNFLVSKNDLHSILVGDTLFVQKNIIYNKIKSYKNYITSMQVDPKVRSHPLYKIYSLGLSKKCISNNKNKNIKDQCEKHIINVCDELNLNIDLVKDWLFMIGEASGFNGSSWSIFGKKYETIICQLFCMIFGVRKDCIISDYHKQFKRQMDFVIKNKHGILIPIEVKLGGKGNNEANDAVIARGSKMLIANHIGDAYKQQFEQQGICFVELQSDDRCQMFENFLISNKIEYNKSSLSIDQCINQVIIHNNEIHPH